MWKRTRRLPTSNKSFLFSPFITGSVQIKEGFFFFFKEIELPVHLIGDNLILFGRDPATGSPDVCCVYSRLLGAGSLEKNTTENPSKKMAVFVRFLF